MSDAIDLEVISADSVELSIPQSGFPTVPEEIGNLYFKAVMAEGLIKRIKEKTKEHLSSGGTAEGLFLGNGSRSTKVTNALAALELLRDEFDEVTSHEFLRCCNVSLPAVEQLYHMKASDGTIQSNRKACRELLKPVLEVTTGKPSVKFSKPGNRQ